MVRSPSSASNCFGRRRRESGQNRVPLPPARTIAVVAFDTGGVVRRRRACVVLDTVVTTSTYRGATPIAVAISRSLA
jgi:hypothetical protein